ncbi:MAG: hypothetical protein IPG23_01030 [Burkholderiales bacterium]|nr:hypothetical protein [Burkholderiales bacterium]
MATKRISTKLLGDAGEHYALSRFSFAGNYAAKMPDNWEGYDLAVETGQGLVRVSVKTRSESSAWRANSWFNWDDRKDCDWFVFIFKAANGQLRSWVIPSEVADARATKPTSRSKTPWYRELSWRKITQPILLAYEDNWSMNTGIPVEDAANANTQEAS